MNRKLKKEVTSLHPSQAGENKQKLNQGYYQQNKEDINRKRREKYQTQKQSDEKTTSTSINQNSAQKNSVHVEVKNRQTKDNSN
jgi:hypothetical protein